MGTRRSRPLLAALVLLVPTAAGAASAGEEVDFARDVRPILEARCVACHGPKRQRGQLRLDAPPAAGIVVPGDALASPLYQRVVHADPEERMPAEGEPLDAAEVATLRRWIEEGARWPEHAPAPAAEGPHWAYVAPVRPAVPADPYGSWARSPIDAFVAEKLHAAGLAPSEEADRATLIRRASLDLTGLPPTLEEVERFLADDSPRAWEDLLDRLLASPHHAEHEARAWLDLARYADSDGYEKDDRRTMWRWRDWVIAALDADMPFDRFTELQLAGDLLPDATDETVLATGFHRNTMTNKEGGTDPEEFRVAAVKDRTDTTATVWLGSTLACAQCHDHKYDPFTQAEYYGFYAFFDGTEDVGNSNAPEVSAPRPADRARAAELAAERTELERTLAQEGAELAGERAAWSAAWSAHADSWRRLVPLAARAQHGSELAVRADGAVLAGGALPDSDAYVVEYALAPPGATVAALRLDVLADPALPGGGPGRPEHRNFVLSELVLERVDAEGVATPLAVRAARADHEQTGARAWPAAAAVDGDPATGWAIAGGEGRAHALVLELAEPLAHAPGTVLRVVLEQRYGSGHLLGCFALAASPAPAPPGPVPPPELAAALAGTDAERAGELADWFRARAPSLAGTRARLADVERERAAVPTAMVLRERVEPRTTRVMQKGSFLAPGEPVRPGTPAVLPPLVPRDPARGADRLDLARWLVAPENPLTARVLVNRTWERVFGRGLVATSADFGTQGERPSHPELLDWLACELVARGWDVDALLRLVLSSATYRQSARTPPALRERDPANVWLARAPRLRHDAETVRDVALAASGLLCADIGGPSVFPPQPDGVWAMTYSDDRWTTSEGCDRYRRGLYTFVRRTAPYPTFLAFDAPSREIACTRRGRTNTPLQALATLNDPAFVECAVALAARMLEGAETSAERVALGFRRCVARGPSPEELAVLLALADAELAGYAERPDDAETLAGAVARAHGLDPRELAAWTVVANVLLNLDETLTKG